MDLLVRVLSTQIILPKRVFIFNRQRKNILKPS